MTIEYQTPVQAPTNSRPSAAACRRAAFGFLATFIILGPAPGQLLGLHSIALREWRMFSGAGVGLLRGTFTLHRADGAVTLSPLEVAGVPRYLDLPLSRRIFQLNDLRQFANRICNDKSETGRLSFEGSLGVSSGWAPLSVHDVCHETLSPAAREMGL
jgi:hypothetical protein